MYAKHKCYNGCNVRAQRYILILAIIIAVAGAVVGYYIWHNAHPAAPKPHEISQGVQSNEAITKAFDLARQQKYTEAIAVLEAVRTKTTYDQDKYDLANAEGSIYLQAKDAVRAHDVLQDAVKVKPDGAIAQVNLGIASQQIADYATALTAFAQAQKLLTATDPDTVKARVTSSLAAIPAQQAQLKDYDPELVRLLGRYSWYELHQDSASASAQYQPVTQFVTAKGVSTDTVNAAHQKVLQVLVSTLSAS